MLKRSKYALLKSNNVFVVYYRDKNLIKILLLTDQYPMLTEGQTEQFHITKEYDDYTSFHNEKQ